MTEYAFVDDSGTTRLEGFLVPDPGGSLPDPATFPGDVTIDGGLNANNPVNIYPDAGDGLHVGDTNGSDVFSCADTAVIVNANAGSSFRVQLDGASNGMIFTGLPTNDPHILGQLWCDTGAARVLKVSAGP